MNTPESTHSNAQSELLKALATSAITFQSDEEANAAGFYMNDGSLTGNGSHGVVIQYLDAFTKQPTDFYRMRYTTPLVDDKGKPIRYKQPPLSRVHAYFPACIDWGRVAFDISTALLITEGEKKAHSTAQNLGIPCIGLGGVNSYTDKLTMGTLLDELLAIEWRNRTVIICYDSDTATNENVQSASFRLAEALSGKGAVPLIVTLPPSATGEKQGLDDFILASGASAVQRYINEYAVEPVLSESLRNFASRCVCVDELLGYVDLPTNTISDRSKLASSVYAAIKVTKRDAKGKSKLVNLFQEYCEWPARTNANVLRSYPGKPRIFTQEVNDIATQAGQVVFNAWTDTRPTRKQGDVTVWKAYLKHMFTNVPELEEYFENWVATMLQTHCKMQTAWVFYSSMTGTGKSTLAYVLGMLVGHSAFLEIADSDLEDEIKSNRMLVGKQLILADDVTSHRNRKDADTLKNVVTRKKARVNLKYVNPFSAMDFRNWIFSTNHADALRIERFDRRFFYVEVPQVKYLTNPSVPDISHFLTNEGAGELLEYYMTYEVPVWFTKVTEPPETESRTAAIEASMSAIELWVNDLKAQATTYNGVSVFDATDLAALALSHEYAQRPVSPVYMTNLLKAAAVVPSAHRVNIDTVEGRRKKTLYCFSEVLTADKARQVYEAEVVARANLLSGVVQLTKC